MKERPKVILNVYLIVENKEGYLLSLRKNTGYEDNKWGLVSGHCEAGEAAKIALCREVKEEININIAEEDLILLHTMNRKTDRYNIDLFMKSKNFQGDIINNEPEKCGGLAFFKIEELPDNVIPYIKEALNNIIKKQPYSEYGWE